MIKLVDNKLSLSESEYKVIKDLYDAFRLEPYAVTLFCYGIKNDDLHIDESVYKNAADRDIDIKDVFYEILKTVSTTDTYIIEK